MVSKVWRFRHSCRTVGLKRPKAQQIATKWRWIYSNERPSMGIAGLTPAMAENGRLRSTVAPRQVSEDYQGIEFRDEIRHLQGGA